MGDLKSPWDNPGTPIPGMEGNGVTARGGDPNVNIGGSGALQDLWPDKDQLMSSPPDGKETANSVSGLPTQPSRFEPSDSPPDMPDLKDRNPGTIDKQ